MSHRVAVAWLLLGGLLGLPSSGSQPEGDYHAGDRARDLVVWISGSDVAGAGLVFGYDGRYVHVMTALHVVRASRQYRQDLSVEFRVWPGRTLPIEMSSFRGRENLDFATFKVNLDSLGIPSEQIKKTLPFDRLGMSRGLKPGARVFTVGHSFAYQWLIPNRPIYFHSTAKASATSPEDEILQVEHQCPPGHSGGALFDEHWRLVGMLLNTEGPFCWALRVETAIGVLREFGWSIDLYQRSVEIQPAAGALASGEIKVAVVGFDNRSGQTDLQSLAPAAHDVISSFLVSLPRVVVATRDRIETVLEEQSRQGTVLSTGELSRTGKLLDVDAILTGSVVYYEERRQEFNGFGTRAWSDEYRMGINLLLIDVDSGRIRLSRVFETTDIVSHPQAGKNYPVLISRESELLQTILEQARPRIQKGLMDLAITGGDEGELRKVPVMSVPEGADVLLGDLWVGSTPVDIELELGPHLIQVTKPGYLPWKQQVKVEPGTRVEINLTKR